MRQIESINISVAGITKHIWITFNVI